ncbi:MAG: DAK2 domain-containing protein [Clostridiales bacterium]|nr:DAK2 domain-containing protein [Clostridiales bacterium]MDY4007722.1 DAK2 domain-containing protein [Candidatus Limiplasma sp.]
MEYSITTVQACIYALGKELVSLRDELTNLDSKLGDGDLGISMARGGTALCAVIESSSAKTLGALFLQCASAFNKAAPSTLGTLLSMGIRALGRAVDGQESVSDAQLIAFPRILANEIALRGRSKLGDKTILDALLPYSDTIEAHYTANGNLREAAIEAAKAAKAGAEATKGMTAHIGRASWLGERNKEYPDGGAVLCYRIAAFLAGFQAS